MDFLGFFASGHEQEYIADQPKARTKGFLQKNRWGFVHVSVVNSAWANTEYGSHFQRGFDCN